MACLLGKTHPMKMVILKQYYYALFLPNNNNVAMDIIISFFNVKNIILLNHNKSFNQLEFNL